MNIAAFTFWHTPTPQTVTAAAIVSLFAVGLALLLVHHLACEFRIERTRRRDRELIEARRAAHRERKWATIAADDAGMAAVRAERDDARRTAVQLLHRNDQLQAELEAVRGELAGARDYVHRLNRSNLARLATVIEADKTMRLPAVRFTRELPAVPAGGRRKVLA